MTKINAANSLLSLSVKAWASLEDNNNDLSKLKNDEETFKVLSAQLNFYRYSMGVKCPIKYYYVIKVDAGK